jgi:3-dehydroquinate synthase
VATGPGELPPPALTVRHAGGSCPVYIGRGLLARLPDFARVHLAGRRLAIISDDRVARAVPVPLDAPRFTFPAGEASKTRATWAALTDDLLGQGFGRDSAIIAVGGGVTGDLAGFVAATCHRGIPVLQVPTTLLAMLDAAVGGKTGVDTPAGKNLVGAFHQPAGVVMDPAVLATLPAEQLRGGLAEAVKHAALADAGHFRWLQEHAALLLAADSETVEALLRHSVPIKVGVVEADETESGPRAILNAGHTVAHALERVTQYRLPHGPAVAIGLVTEAVAGERLHLTAPGTATALSDLLRLFELPTRVPPAIEADALLEAMRADKKNRAGAIHLALLSRIGETHGQRSGEWTTPVEENVLLEAIAGNREA